VEQEPQLDLQRPERTEKPAATQARRRPQNLLAPERQSPVRQQGQKTRAKSDYNNNKQRWVIE